MSIFESCPVLESERYMLRLTSQDDTDGLLAVYSDRNALPFFNSDCCNGDIFYYTTHERMREAVEFWSLAYRSGWFARLTVIEKNSGDILGTVEVCYRASDDAFDGMCILRLDVGSAYETEPVLTELFGLILPHTDALLGGKGVVTKAPDYAVERIKALQNNGFDRSEHPLVGNDGSKYSGYWTKE